MVDERKKPMLLLLPSFSFSQSLTFQSSGLSAEVRAAQESTASRNNRRRGALPALGRRGIVGLLLRGRRRKKKGKVRKRRRSESSLDHWSLLLSSRPHLSPAVHADDKASAPLRPSPSLILLALSAHALEWTAERGKKTQEKERRKRETSFGLRRHPSHRSLARRRFPSSFPFERKKKPAHDAPLRPSPDGPEPDHDASQNAFGGQGAAGRKRERGRERKRKRERR